MAYCDYLFRRSNGIFYFRYIFKFQRDKPREIRISMETRSYGLAKQLAASCFVKLNRLLQDASRFDMNPDKLLKSLKVELKKVVDPENNEHQERFESVYSDIERKVLWVRQHISEKFEGKSVKEVLDIYREYAPVFNQVKSEINDSER